MSDGFLRGRTRVFAKHGDAEIVSWDSVVKRVLRPTLPEVLFTELFNSTIRNLHTFSGDRGLHREYEVRRNVIFHIPFLTRMLESEYSHLTSSDT